MPGRVAGSRRRPVNSNPKRIDRTTEPDISWKVVVLVGVGIVLVLMTLAGAFNFSGGHTAEHNQDVLNHETPVWECINNGGTWNGPTDGGSCK
jgi:hypothetical protein